MSKEESKKGTAVAVVGSVPDMLVTLKKRIESIKRITDTPYKTTGNLEGFGDIKAEQKIENLIRAFSSVRGRADAYAKASEELGLGTVPEFSISGGNVEDWKQDIKLRIAIVEQDTTLKKLEEVQKEMSELLDKEDRKAIVADKLAALLGS